MKWFADPSDPREAPESWAHVRAAQLLEVRRRAEAAVVEARVEAAVVEAARVEAARVAWLKDGKPAFQAVPQ